MNKKVDNIILTAIALLFIFIQYGLKNKEIKIKSPYYSEMVEASEKMKIISTEIKNERIRRGITIDKNLDINETGLIGEEWSGITTTLGNLESKRTSTNPDFAALLVKLFKEKGLKKGDIIAANLSSSFPALNLSLIAAADTLGLEAVMVNSVGSSTYGGNIEDFTYLDMENHLFSKGMIRNRSRGFSLGGIGDIGKEFEKEIKEKIVARNKKYGLKFFYNENLTILLLKNPSIPFKIIKISYFVVFKEAGMNAISLKGRSILGLQDFTAGEIERILEVAAQMKKIVLSDNKKRDFLKGKSIVTVFSEASTRTRSSFELAGKYLGADVINITKSGSSMTKGESMRDTLLTVSAMGVDAVIIRDSSEGAALFASKVMSPKVKVPVVINAGDGAHAHPTQALLELFTLKEAGKNIKGMKYVIIGDILHSRVARSDIYGFTKLGAEVHLVGPRTLVPKELESMGVIVDDNLEDALRDADAINILRIQLERAAGGFIPTTREYARLFGINKKRLELCKKDAAIIHPGPMNRGIEIGYDVAYDESSWIQEEVRNGVAVRMALEYLTLTEGKDIEAGH